MSSSGGPRPSRATAPLVPLDRLVRFASARAEGDPEGVLVGGVTHDSSEVREGDVFAALAGARHHGARFAADAVARGAVAVLTDEVGARQLRESGLTVPVLVATDPRGVLGELSAEVYGRPADSLLTLGVTGTNGKTTTAHLIHHALGVLGRRAGLVGTIETRVGDEAFASVRTTPEATDLQALFAVMRERDADSMVMEVSSIAVEMGRVDGFVLDVAGFTNLSQDHLDFHGDMESYHRAKADVFTPAHARRGVVVTDDAAGSRIAREATVPVTTVSALGTDADWTTADVRTLEDGRTALTVRGPEGFTADTVLAVLGRLNVANALLATAMLAAAGIDARAALDAVASCPGVPGRMQRIEAGDVAPIAIVDYAHTPDAVATLLRDVRTYTDGRVVIVLGCGGDRDAGKRPLMGAAAAKGADVLVVTDDNPRSEDPATIRAAMLDGANAVPAGERAEVVEVADRREAIRTAVQRAGRGDVLVVAGKGHEQGQESAGVVTPFDDASVLRTALQELTTP